jgi:hypothetical protein
MIVMGLMLPIGVGIKVFTIHAHMKSSPFSETAALWVTAFYSLTLFTYLSCSGMHDPS